MPENAAAAVAIGAGESDTAAASAGRSIPSRRGGVVVASSGYFISQALIMLAGFVSMPVMTRLLSRAEYGLLNLVLASVSILALFGRLGFPQAITRFFPERRREGAGQLSNFCGTMLGGSFAASALVGLIVALSVEWTGVEPHYARCLQLACLVVVTRVLLSVIYQVYRAQERIFAFSAAQIVSRFGTLALTIALLLLGHGTASEVIIATVIGEAVVAAACLLDLVARGVVSWPKFSWPAITGATAYGLPLVLASSASFVLDYGDRFLIERFLGLDAVANYAVPYDLVQNVASAVFGPVNLAVLPIVLRLWSDQGSEVATRRVSKIASYLVALAIPLAAMVLIMNRDLIVLLASAKYSSSATLTPYLLPGVFIGELNFLFVLGLMINNDTMILAVFTVLAGVLNLCLNLLLLARWGLPGAAAATTASYAVLMAVTWLRSRPVLHLRLRYGLVAKSMLATGIMVAAIAMLGPVFPQLVLSLAIRGAVGAAIVVLCMWILDPETRSLISFAPRLNGGT